MAIVAVPRERSPFAPVERPRFDPPAPGRSITFRVTSLDTGLTLAATLPPSEHDRNFGADWQEADVAQMSVQFLEYLQTLPEERVYKINFDAYNRPGGLANDIENEYKILKAMTERVPGKTHAHRLLCSQGVQRFRCVLVRVTMPVTRIASNGGAQRAHDCTLTFKELAGRGR